MHLEKTTLWPCRFESQCKQISVYSELGPIYRDFTTRVEGNNHMMKKKNNKTLFK